MSRTVDHVAFAAEDLDAVREACESVGLPTEYGGVHGTGTTHMAIVGFPDGSYLELVAPTPETDPDDADYWPAHCAADAGPAGWCLEVADVSTAAKRAVDAGVPVDGPHAASRQRDDGTLVEWDMVFQGPADDWRLPFLIRDRTPREYRVTPTPGLADGPLRGIETVVVASAGGETTADLFARRHRYPTPVPIEGPFGGLETVPGRPVALVEATDRLDSRIAAVGPGPCAYLLGTDDLAAAADVVDLAAPEPWGDRRVAWLDHATFDRRLGVVEV